MLVLGAAIQQVHSYSKSAYFPRDDWLGKPCWGFLQQLPPCHSMSPLIARAMDVPRCLCPKTAAVPQQRNIKYVSAALVFCNPWLTITTVTGPFRNYYATLQFFVLYFLVCICCSVLQRTATVQSLTYIFAAFYYFHKTPKNWLIALPVNYLFNKSIFPSMTFVFNTSLYRNCFGQE